MRNPVVSLLKDESSYVLEMAEALFKTHIRSRSVVADTIFLRFSSRQVARTILVLQGKREA